ncbi:hypothetical protein ACE6H2_011053 [Prunus campanulata]
MSDAESESRRSPRAYEDESSSGSSTEESESVEIIEKAEVRTEAGGTSRRLPQGGESSTSGRGAEAGDVSIAAPGEGVLTVVKGKQRVPMAKPKGPVFGVDFLEPNVLIEGELARIRVEYQSQIR